MLTDIYVWRDQVYTSVLHFGDAQKTYWFSLIEDAIFDLWGQAAYDALRDHVGYEPCLISLELGLPNSW